MGGLRRQRVGTATGSITPRVSAPTHAVPSRVRCQPASRLRLKLGFARPYEPLFDSPLSDIHTFRCGGSARSKRRYSYIHSFNHDQSSIDGNSAASTLAGSTGVRAPTNERIATA